MNMLKEEQRVIVNFLIKLGGGSNNILKKLCTVYKDGALKMTVVYKLIARYKEGWESLEDDPRSRTSFSTHNDENEKRVDELLPTNWRILNRYIAKTCGISRETVRLIIAEDLNMRKLCLRIVPKSSMEEEEQRVADSNFLDRVITGDELWFFEYNPSDQQANKAYVKKGERNLKTLCRSCSNIKVHAHPFLR